MQSRQLGSAWKIRGESSPGPPFEDLGAGQELPAPGVGEVAREGGAGCPLTPSPGFSLQLDPQPPTPASPLIYKPYVPGSLPVPTVCPKLQLFPLITRRPEVLGN